MEWLLLIPLVAFATYILMLAAVWYARIGHWYLLAELASLQESFQDGAAGIAERLERREQRKRVEHRFAVAAGASGAIDHEAVEAAKQMPIVRRVLDEELPKAIVRCIRVHRLAAAAVGARYIREIAHEPECSGSRQRVVGLAAAAIEALEKYHFLVEDEALMANLITLRSRVVPVCCQCPYLHYRVQEAPLLCPTANTTRIDPERVRKGLE